MMGRGVRRFGDVLVVVNVEGGEPCGCELRLRGKVWRLPHWPDRLLTVAVLDGDRLAVTFRDGSSRLLEDGDLA